MLGWVWGLRPRRLAWRPHRSIAPSAHTQSTEKGIKNTNAHRHGLAEDAEDEPEGEVPRLRLAEERLLEVIRDVDEGDLAPVCWGVRVYGGVVVDRCGPSISVYVCMRAHPHPPILVHPYTYIIARKAQRRRTWQGTEMRSSWKKADTAKTATLAVIWGGVGWGWVEF